MKPVGPEEPQIYWRRRALVAGVVLLALLILFLIFRPKGDDQPEAATTSPPPTTTPSPASPSPSGTTSASPSASPSVSRQCPDTDIEVTVSPNAQTYPAAGKDPEITLVVANIGSFACLRDVGGGANEIFITSDGTQVWSSDDCATEDVPNVQPFDPGKSATVTIPWPRMHSAAGCPAGQPAAEAGAYEAVGRNGNVESQPVPFTLQ